MNIATAELVEEAIRRSRGHLLDGLAPALIGVDAAEPQWFATADYWLSPYAFEAEMGDLSREQRAFRVVFAIPLITLTLPDGPLVFRPLDGTISEGEEQLIWAITVDLEDGLTIHRCRYHWAPDGLPIFEAIQTYNGDVRLDEGAPGWQLMQSVIRD